MAKTGRPQIEIDQEQFEKLCYMQCTLSEIAGWFHCSEDTIERWCRREYEQTFAEVYKTHSAGGKISIRRWQFRLAEHNVSMAIWLGKQYLGQRDLVEVSAPVAESSIENIAKQIMKDRNRKKS